MAFSFKRGDILTNVNANYFYLSCWRFQLQVQKLQKYLHHYSDSGPLSICANIKNLLLFLIFHRYLWMKPCSAVPEWRCGGLCQLPQECPGNTVPSLLPKNCNHRLFCLLGDVSCKRWWWNCGEWAPSRSSLWTKTRKCVYMWDKL